MAQDSSAKIKNSMSSLFRKNRAISCSKDEISCFRSGLKQLIIDELRNRRALCYLQLLWWGRWLRPPLLQSGKSWQSSLHMIHAGPRLRPKQVGEEAHSNFLSWSH